MPIYQKVKNLIEQNGYITIDEMMLQAMSVHNNSYYRKQNNIGERGDFITAPEISQLFGEIIALWTIEQWYKIGCPKQTNLVELGPGQGTLMKDLLRVAKLVPEFYRSLQLELLEINPHFIEKQKTNLQNIPLRHITSIKQITKIPSIIIANEFFDALPIKQYIKNDNLWYEIVLIINNTTDRLKFDKIEISKQLQNYLQKQHPCANNLAIIEMSPQSQDIMRFISEHINQFNGAALIIDYGYDIDPASRTKDQYNSTLQAIKDHNYTDILETLGKADLSAHVDFYALKMLGHLNHHYHSSQGKSPISVTTQREFLINYGILLRSQNLQNKLSQMEADLIERQVDRLINPNKMGELFKILSVNSQ